MDVFGALCAGMILLNLTGKPAIAQTVAFTNVNVVTMNDDALLEGQTVIIRDGVVVAIGPVGELSIPSGGEVIDGDGRYLMPGLADMHVHLRERNEYINYLAHGVTTVMTLGGSWNRAIQIRDDRDAISNGELLGPNIIATARIFDGDPPTGGGSTLQSLATVDEARAAVEELDEAGFDVVKTYNNISREAFDVIVEEAAARGMPVVGHIPRNFDTNHSLGAGLDVVAHSEEFFFTVFQGPRSTSNIDKSYRPDLSLIPELVELLVNANVFVTPNLSYPFGIQLMWDGLENIWTDPEMAYLAPSTVGDWRGGNLGRRDNVENFVYRDAMKYGLLQELARRFQDAGIPLLLGTDAAIETAFPGKSAHRELRELVKAGLTNRDALEIATRNAGSFAAEHLDSIERFGRVAVGYRADLLLTEQNPLEDVRNVERIAGVMVRGHWVDRAEIDDRRASLAAHYAELNQISGLLADAFDAGMLAESAAAMASKYSENEEALGEIEQTINTLGYRYVGSDDLERALDVFEVNTILFPGSANTWDSLAETYLSLGNRDKSIELYRKAIEVDPTFDNARTQLDRILSGS